MNKDISYATNYHEATNHSEVSLMTSRHYLDWNNRPMPFKVYTDSLSTYTLPTDFPTPTMDAITSICNRHYNHESSTTSDPDMFNRNITLKDLSEILFFSAGITRVMRYNYGTYYMRAASATGALYPIELYIVCRDLSPNLKAGVYHFCPAEFNLTEIRSGDYMTQLSIATGNNSSILNSQITIIFTSFAWRNAWKYQARSYRHWYWDSGVIAANLLAITTSMNISSELVMGFVDDTLNNLLRLEKQKEATILMAAISTRSSSEKVEIGDAKKLEEIQRIPNLPSLKAVPLSKSGEIDYFEIWRLHQASKLDNKNEVKGWINRYDHNIDKTVGKTSDTKQESSLYNPIKIISEDSSIKKLISHNDSVLNLGETILMRGSTRKFTVTPIPFSILSVILSCGTTGTPMDFLRNGDTVIDIYLIANEIENLTRGGYFFNSKSNSLEVLKRHVSREMSGYLCLGQSLFSDASAVLFLMCNLKNILDILGNRGYRAAQFEAGVIAGKIYLSAYAQGIGASGSTFFDEAVTEFFSPHAENKSPMIAIGIGKPDYKAKSGKVLPVKLTREQLLTGNI
ncbi:MAG TPA: SagB/ThcOx family dehydrogenase [Nitrososphaeraceae archaeon]